MRAQTGLVLAPAAGEAIPFYLFSGNIESLNNEVNKMNLLSICSRIDKPIPVYV